MNRTFTKILVLALLVVTSFSACKKDDDDSLSINKENLVGTYTIVSIKGRATNVPEQDLTDAYLDACEKDDQIILKSDLTIDYKDAGTQCNPVGTGTGSWNLSGTTFTFYQDDYTIKSLTKGSMVLEQSETSGSVTTTITFNFSRK